MSSTPRIILATGLSLAAISALPSCSTEEIKLDGGGKYFDLYTSPTDEARARFALSVAPDAQTWEARQALASLRDPKSYLKIDGRWAAIVQPDGSRNPLQLFPAGIGSWTGWMPAGSHVFEMVDSNGKRILQTPASYDVLADQGNHLVVYGAADSHLHKFFSYGFDVPAGTVRYNVINLLRTGEMIQVVKCDAPGSNCATFVSDPLGYGEVTIGDVATEPFNLSYRIIPATAFTPIMNPAIIPNDLLATQLPDGDGGQLNPFVFATAPCIVTDGVVTASLY